MIYTSRWSCTQEDPRIVLAARAYARTYEGPWGLKADAADVIFSIVKELYPELPQEEMWMHLRNSTSWQRLADLLWEDLESSGLEGIESVRIIVPIIDVLIKEVL